MGFTCSTVREDNISVVDIIIKVSPEKPIWRWEDNIKVHLWDTGYSIRGRLNISAEENINT